MARILLLLALLLAGAAVPNAAAPSSHKAPTAFELEIVREINGVRKAHGLRPVRVSYRLDSAAAAHSNELAARGIFQHDSADGTVFWKRVQRYYVSSGYRYWAVGENLVWSTDLDAKQALKLWMASPHHRANILTPRWREIGISAVSVASGAGVYQDLPVTIVTTDFGVRR